MALINFEFRESLLADVWRGVNGDLPVPQAVLNLKAWECVQGPQVVGHCTADSVTGEVVGLAVDPAHRRQGIARTLLTHIVADLQAHGAARIWVAAPGDSTLPAYHFYRAVGWRASGERLAYGEEIFELPHKSVG